MLCGFAALALHTMRQDPALPAGIWLTIVTDVAGFLLFLGLGAAVVGRL
jgi:Mg/Co/Ni transporter MgtE